jgi:pimeloyl-ACP methyl ester carboxylesterase
MHTIRVGDATIAYRDSGGVDRPVALLLHGGGSTGATWDTVTPELHAAGLRVIAPDLRGHGASGRHRRYPLGAYRDDLLLLLDALALNRFVLVGHSLGGYVACLLAQARPECVTRLVLEDPAPPPRNPAAAPSFSPLRTAALGVSLLTGWRRRYDRRALLSAIAQLRIPDSGWWDALGGVPAPTLVISGGPRSHVSTDSLAALATALPTGTLAVVPVGHRIHSLAPAAFTATVLPFLMA